MQEEVKSKAVKEQNSGSYIFGTVGALIGGLLLALPWALAQVFLGYYAAVIACLIGFGACLGYKMLKGKMGPATKNIIRTVAVISAILGELESIQIMLMWSNADTSAHLMEKLTGKAAPFIFANLALGIIIALLGTIPAQEFLKKGTNTPPAVKKAEL